MGVITDIFKSFYIPSVRRAGSQVVTDIQSISKVGTVTRARTVRRAPRVRPRTRRAGIHRIKRRIATSISKLSRSRQARFVNRELTRIDSAIKRETKARIPTLRNIQIAGYKYGRAHPNSAKLIYSSGNDGAKIVRNAIPKTVSPSKAMFAFSDGVIHGIRNEPIKKLSETFLKPKDMKPEDIIKRKERLKAWQAKDLPKWVTDFVGDPLKLSDRERKIVLPFYGKTSAEALQQKKAMTSYLNYVGKEIKQNPAKIALFAALPPVLKTAGRGIQAAGITRLITKVKHGEYISRKTIQGVSLGLGVVYADNMHKRVIAPVETGKYKDGDVINETRKTLPNGDIVIEQEIEQIPITRKPTRQEQIERMGGIFATELAPLGISHRIVNRGVKAGYKKPPEAKPKVKITKKIVRAGKVIKTTPAKIKTLPKKIKKVPTKVKDIPVKTKAKILKTEKQIQSFTLKTKELIKLNQLRLKQKITRVERKRIKAQLNKLDTLLTHSQKLERWKVEEARLLRQKGKTVEQLEKDTLKWKKKQDATWRTLEKSEKWINKELTPKITRVSKIKASLKSKILKRELQIKSLIVKIKALIKQNKLRLKQKITRAERKRIKTQLKQLDTLLSKSKADETWKVAEARLLRQKGKTVAQLEKDTLAWKAKQDATWKALEKHETWITKSLKPKPTPIHRIKVSIKSKILKKEMQIKTLTKKITALKQRLTQSYNRLSLKERKRKKALYKQRMNQLKTLVDKSWKLERWKVDEAKLITMSKPKTKAIFDKIDKNIKSLDIKTKKATEWVEVEAPKNGKLLTREEVKKFALQEKIVAKRKAREAAARKEAAVVSGDQVLLTKTEMVSVGKKTHKIDIVSERKKANALMNQLVVAQKKAQAEAGMLNKLKIEAKSIHKTKARTVTEAKAKNKQLHDINGKIKTKRKAILKYKQKMKNVGKRLKHTEKLYLILLQKGKQIPELRFKQFIVIVPKQIDKIIEDNARIITYIDKIIQTPIQKTVQVPVQKPVQIIIPKPRQRIIPTTKPKLITIPVPVIIPPAIPPRKKKVEPKKKRKKKKIGVEEFYVKNPLPTLKSLYGY